MIWKLALGILAIIFITRRLIVMRNAVIARKLKNVSLPKDEERKLWYLANMVLERAKKEGVLIPKKSFVYRIDDDPYTWVILKLGFRDKEIYRTRVSVEDITYAAKMAQEEEEKEEN